MVSVPSKFQWTRNRLFPVTVLFIRRSMTVKVFGILLVLAIIECLYLLNASLLEKAESTTRNTGMDCYFTAKLSQLEGRCSFNDSQLVKTGSKGNSQTTMNSLKNVNQQQSMINITTISHKELNNPFTNLSMDNVLEDIQLGSAPFPLTNPHPYTRISFPANCNFRGDSSKILIMMYSRPGNTHQRKILRLRWRKLRDQNVRLVFLLGLLEDVQYVVEDESEQYGDVLQEDFEDSHRNKTIKIIMGYNWAVNYCPSADVILSVDETLRLKSDILIEYIRDLLSDSPTGLFRGQIQTNQRTENFNVNLVSRDVANQFQIIFPYIKINDNDVSHYLRNVANILSVKWLYDPYFDPENPVSYFASAGQNVSRQLLSYPLNINLRRLVRQKVVNGEEISQQSVNKEVLPLIQSPSRCNNLTRGNFIDHFLVIIWSDTFDSEQRSAIRDMWGYPNTIVKLVFVLGLLEVHQTTIDVESKKYGDILQISAEKDKFYDTIKTVATFKWIVQNCKNTDFILFLDGNIDVSISMLTTFMKKLVKSNVKNSFLGHVVIEKKPDRRLDSLSYISENDYPFDEVPPRMAGLNYLLSFNIAESFHIAFPFVKYCSAVDIYVGIVASKLMIVPRNDEHFDRRNPNSFLRGVP